LVPQQSWYVGEASPRLESVGAFRFDDPDGEVGIETLLVRVSDGPVLQVPMTYRGAPLRDGEQWLIGTMEHTVLGQRWAYEACGDPVYVTALAASILHSGTEAEVWAETDGRRERRAPTVSITGTGFPEAEAPILTAVDELTCSTHDDRTFISAAGLELTVLRAVGGAPSGDLALRGTRAGQENPVVLATHGTPELIPGDRPFCRGSAPAVRRRCPRQRGGS